MVRRLTALYPFLFAAVYVLYLAWQSPGYFELGDLLLILAVVLAGTGVIYLVSAAIFRNRADGRLPALVTFLILLASLGLPLRLLTAGRSPAECPARRDRARRP